MPANLAASGCSNITTQYVASVDVLAGVISITGTNNLGGNPTANGGVYGLTPIGCRNDNHGVGLHGRYRRFDDPRQVSAGDLPTVSCLFHTSNGVSEVRRPILLMGFDFIAIPLPCAPDSNGFADSR